jgi:alkyldihydroxyacetonephosphate synthase
MVDDRLVDRIRDIVGAGAVSSREPDRRIYSQDMWPRMNVLKMSGLLPDSRPDAVVWPSSDDEVCSVVRLCLDAGVPVIPAGAGSGVCGGINPVEGGVVLDLKRMNRLLAVDDLSHEVTVEAGMNGQLLEDALNERGFTLGHFPSSIMCSTVGGWAATRSAGQYSSRFGKIEDMITALDVVLPNGTLVTLDGSRPVRQGPDFCQLLIGSEGTLGVIVRVRLRIHPAARVRRFGGFRFMEMDMGIEAMRRIMQSGLRPTVMRLYDPLDTLLNSFSSSRAGDEDDDRNAVLDALRRAFGLEGKDFASALTGPLLRRFLAHPGVFQTILDVMPLSSMLVLGFEGDDARTREDLAEANELAMRATGRDLGPGPGEHWLAHRYDVSYKLTKVFNQGAFADTLEVAGLWHDVSGIYKAVRTSIKNRVIVMAHFSHAYREGCACYFTMAGYAGGPKGLIDLYDWTISTALSKAMGAGATVSHHHGIGMMKRAFTEQEYRGGNRLFWAVKRALDPGCIMNPQKVYPATVPAVRYAPDDADVDPDFKSALSWDHRTPEEGRVIPELPEEIPEILEIARSRGQALTCQPGEPPVGRRRSRSERGNELVLSLRMMDQVLDMDPVSGTVTVQAGMTMLQVENTLREKGFSLGFVPRRQLNLSVGDYLAGASPMAGSPLYGTVRENCIGLSAVLADGTLFSARPTPRRAAGPELMHCFIGAGGRYGVITAACFRVFPAPAVREAVAFGSDDPVMAVSAVRTILTREVRPEWILGVLRAPSAVASRRRFRMVAQLGGSRSRVSTDLRVIRDVMEPLGMEPEPIRAEERLVPPARRWPFREAFLPMARVMEMTGRFALCHAEDCPEVHITHFRVEGATFRVLLREDAHRFPGDVNSISRWEFDDPVLKAAGDLMKNELDPEGVLASSVREE